MTVFPVFATPADDASYIVRDNYHHRRQAAPVPPWVIALLIFAVVAWWSPLGLIVALVMLSILAMQHVAIALAFAGVVLILIIAAVRERLAGRSF